MQTERMKGLRDKIIAYAGKANETRFWRWLDEPSSTGIDKRRGNKFLLGCSLDYMIRADKAWEGARRLAEDILGDPDDLWERVTSVPLPVWNSRFRTYGLHRFPKAHERIWTIGKKVLADYEGDARLIWYSQRADIVLKRLENIRLGEQLSRMMTGALIDTGHIEGTVDVKADTHVCRVLGRSVLGTPLSASESGKATRIARNIFPSNPWQLDRPLYRVGKTICHATKPSCGSCPLRLNCLYYETTPSSWTSQ